jgi:hypothetical protein
MSSEDIDKGALWYFDIASNIELSHFGIICLTSDNIESPWIHFEAGALSKKMDKSRVCPYLFGIDPSVIKGPLVLFQAAISNKGDTRKLLQSINQALAESALSSEKLDKAFERWWPDLEIRLEDISKVRDQPLPRRSEVELLEEILETVRSLSRSTVFYRGGSVSYFDSPEGLEQIRNISAHYQNLPDDIKEIIAKKGARD